ncbi:hypothetical protein TNCT_268641 [Trichonephila clavata]|uniref:Uncharacterized protein n=1 Tax=Trichonephila clavata TaxID=2740835 RepID=A0A8X6KWR1_TRICU|nr:hypothetical protein TNCT_268641 [Trichonephila clavata]
MSRGPTEDPKAEFREKEKCQWCMDEMRCPHLSRKVDPWRQQLAFPMFWLDKRRSRHIKVEEGDQGRPAACLKKNKKTTTA